ncbi:MAG: hypothetical protein D6704_03085 [Nitrospirae bacterium]|nr:MAG: hypothetical protein D6704_03085 [Nitrospirota bacterium]
MSQSPRSSPSSAEHPVTIEAFRHRVQRVRESHKAWWEATKRLVTQEQLPTTLTRLTVHIRRSTLPLPLQMALLHAWEIPQPGHAPILHTDQLKRLTGMPPTKALRALCLFFGLIPSPPEREKGQTLSLLEIVTFIKQQPNPYDLLLQAQTPSLLDVGAGNLQFEEELVAQYVPRLHHPPLIVHAIDRLQPGSQFGRVYQADPARLARLKRYPSAQLRFRFWGGVDLLDLPRLSGILPRYTLVTCHAPATPTFALEPSRLSPEVIHAHLRHSKGPFRKIRVSGEEALAVWHQDRELLFPPWKFDIHGPLALLAVMLHFGHVCLLTAVDQEVFWEVLAQLVTPERYRPTNVVFSPQNLPAIFGDLYSQLSAMAPGDLLDLSDLAPLRSPLPTPQPLLSDLCAPAQLHAVLIYRGAVFPHAPASFTARQFPALREEVTPWCLILVPAHPPSSSRFSTLDELRP